MRDHNDAAITIDGVSKQYEGEGGTTTALREISLSVSSGEFVTVLGPSGCGKTTLLRLVSGLESPTDGDITVAGKLVQGPDPNRGTVFQAYHLFPWLTVRENVAFGLVEQGVPDAERQDRVQEMLEVIGLSNFADAYPKELSGGMKQRVGLARALAVDPDILLMDEPFGSVDMQTRRQLQHELIHIWRDTDKTVLFVTHDIEEAVALSDRIVVMSGTPGCVQATVSVAESRPRNRSAQWFVDQVETLFERIKSNT
ncbi:ABC transporter ATP-binding protein [Haloarcula argentinensis]|uniref:ABC transporter ATP-binding protein n=1 Tax=Haloarcula argentinensis TaxID=43776 RepID=UPI0002B23506|nr:ABC transporter ATP-binding protein [Haloarcula argentinensis]EMA25181.1 ABC-type nitrate/sulfonate/bicarbonate transport system, ATPase component [Haloarcula argentinensis DSM 12282]